MAEITKRCGYVGIAGRPNAGKSTLLNAIVGRKLAGVSQKPQTTRHRIVGVKMRATSQLLFVDAPGMHKETRQLPLNSILNKEAWASVAAADVILYLVDVTSGWHQYDAELLGQMVKPGGRQVILVVTKCDKVKNSAVREAVAGIEQQAKAVITGDDGAGLSIMALSAKDRASLEPLLQQLETLVPVGPYLYDSEQLSDKDHEFFVREFIQEQLFRLFGQEIPYQCTVVMEAIEFTKTAVLIDAKIVVARDSQKGMLIGKQGAKIKEIGTGARQQIQDLFQKTVNLDLRVTVNDSWHESLQKTLELGGFDV